MNKPRISILNVFMNSYPEKMMEPILQKAKTTLCKQNIVIAIENCSSMQKAIRVANQFKKQELDLVVVFFSTWVDASVPITAIRELGNIPVLLWAFPMLDDISTGSLVGFSVVKPVLVRMNIECDWVYGLPEEVFATINEKAQLHMIKRQLRQSRIGLIGYASMGMYTATCDHVSLKEKLGPEILHIDNVYLVDKMKTIRSNDIERKYQQLTRKKNIALADPELKESVERAISMYLALKRIIAEEGLDSFSIKCQHEISDTIGCLCLPLSLLADEGIVCNCEGDIPGLLTLKFLYMLTGKPSFFADFINAKEQYIYFSKCGYIPLSLVRGDITLEQQVPEIGTSGVLVSGMPITGAITIARLGIDKETAYQMHIASGIAQAGLKRKYKTDQNEIRSLFPFSKVQLNYPSNRFIENVQANHYVLSFSKVEEQLQALCQLMKIKIIKDV